MTNLNRSLNSDDGVSSTLIGSEDVDEDVEVDESALADQRSQVDQSSLLERVLGNGSRERDGAGCRNGDGVGKGES